LQAQFAGLNFEFPVRAGVALDPVVSAWGEFRADPVNVAEAGRLQAQAVRLMDRAGWK
jgi:iron(III) transport system substrate-binding protein